MVVRNQPADAAAFLLVRSGLAQQGTGDSRAFLLLIRTGGRAVAALRLMDANVVQQCRRFKDVLRVRVQTLAAAEQLTVAVYL